MKNYLITILFSISLLSCFAQSSFTSSPRFALGSSEFKEIRSSSSQDVSSVLMLAMGLNASYMFNENFGVATDLMINYLGSEVYGTEGSAEEEYKDIYRFFRLEFPVLAKVVIPVNEDFSLYGFSGPSFDFNLTGSYERIYENETLRNEGMESFDNLEAMSTSFKFGGGIAVASPKGKKFFIDARYSKDLNNFMEGLGNKDKRLGYFSFTFGYGF